MRFIKMLGLAAIAALASMALIGASTATAATSTALCKVLVEGACPTDQIYTGHVEGLATSPTLLTNLGNVLCDHSVILGNVLGLGNPLVGHIELIDFTGNCHIGGVPCTVTTIALGLLDLLRTKHNHGTVTSLGSDVLIVCGEAFHCVYGGNFNAGLALGYNAATSELATIHTEGAAVPNKGGLLCPKTANWDALYQINLPHEIYIEE